MQIGEIKINQINTMSGPGSVAMKAEIARLSGIRAVSLVAVICGPYAEGDAVKADYIVLAGKPNTILGEVTMKVSGSKLSTGLRGYRTVWVGDEVQRERNELYVLGETQAAIGLARYLATMTDQISQIGDEGVHSNL